MGGGLFFTAHGKT